MIGLVEFLQTAGLPVETGKKKLKVHLACWNGHDHPIDVYFAGGFDDWQASQKQRNFSCSQVLSLIDLGNSEWLFVGLYEVIDCKSHPREKGRLHYSMELLPKQEELVARIVVRHKRPRQSYIWLTPEIALPIVEIRRQKLTIGEFPGYNAVAISHSQLQIITNQKIWSWYGALANVKGVYLITDTTTGKHYVGKASGDVGIWQRWCSYAKTGHGGNKELKKLLSKKGGDYARHFQYSILEIADSNASEQDIRDRESHWMNTLKSRDFGLN